MNGLLEGGGGGRGGPVSGPAILPSGGSIFTKCCESSFFPFYGKVIYLKGQLHEIFDCRCFHESVSHRPLSIPLGSLRIFSKIQTFTEIFTAQGAPPVSLTTVAIEKNLK